MEEGESTGMMTSVDDIPVSVSFPETGGALVVHPEKAQNDRITDAHRTKKTLE